MVRILSFSLTHAPQSFFKMIYSIVFAGIERVVSETTRIRKDTCVVVPADFSIAVSRLGLSEVAR